MICMADRGPGHLTAQTDRTFLDSFHERSLDRFPHMDHLRLAWIVMRAHGLDEGLRIIRRGIREFAEYQGAAGRYHETLTMFWGLLVNHAIGAHPEIGNFDEFLASFPFLLDKGLALRHWTNDSLWSNQARARWTEPDLLPLP